jgi:hypothetical protein
LILLRTVTFGLFMEFGNCNAHKILGKGPQ